MLLSTSDDSSSEILVQKVNDVICAMDRRPILLKPPPPGWTDRQMDRQTERWMDRQMDGQTDRQTDRRTDGWTKGQTDSQIERQIEGKRDRHIEKKKLTEGNSKRVGNRRRSDLLRDRKTAESQAEI